MQNRSHVAPRVGRHLSCSPLHALACPLHLRTRLRHRGVPAAAARNLFSESAALLAVHNEGSCRRPAEMLSPGPQGLLLVGMRGQGCRTGVNTGANGNLRRRCALVYALDQAPGRRAFTLRLEIRDQHTAFRAGADCAADDV